MDHFATRCRHQPKRLAPERSGFGRCLKPEMLEVMARWEVTLIGKKGHRYGMVGVNRFLRATPPGPGRGPNFACTTWAANGPSRSNCCGRNVTASQNLTARAPAT